MGSGLVPREKFKSISWSELLDCWQLHGLQHYTRGRGRRASIIQHVGKPVTRERGAGARPCLGKIPITHIHVPGLINFIIPNPLAMIESLRTNI